ncbi:MAG: hypothetical protein KKF16_06775 [Euryarchaeota archaeon]|nr:hypothetical protein [Euryarchaeota archaeon]MBU4608948.1 hypothetical protein [Euryarchaeota archaeon]MBV1730325.1 hypothetical protein [Methanobacterium sp.]
MKDFMVASKNMEKNLIQDQKYLTGLLTGFILAAIVMIGFNRYQDNIVSVDENKVVENGQEGIVVDGLEKNIESKADVPVATVISNQNYTGVTYDDLVGISSANPEAPHSPELQRLDIVLREAGRMIERMEKDIIAIKETQIATVNQ